jgi:hypothetical protein
LFSAATAFLTTTLFSNIRASSFLKIEKFWAFFAGSTASVFRRRLDIV